MTSIREGTQFICALPKGYDDRTQIKMSPSGEIIVAHPDFPPCFLEDDKLVEITLDVDPQ